MALSPALPSPASWGKSGARVSGRACAITPRNPALFLSSPGRGLREREAIGFGMLIFHRVFARCFSYLKPVTGLSSD